MRKPDARPGFGSTDDKMTMEECGYLLTPKAQALMTEADAGWEQRIAELWKAIDDYDPEDFRTRVDVLVAELQAASDELDGAVRAFLALALVDLGREREAVAISLTALSHYLPRYNRSLARYARDLATGDPK